MKRLLILCAAVVLIMLSACGDHNAYEKNNSAVDSVTTSEVTNELTSSDFVNGANDEDQSATSIIEYELEDEQLEDYDSEALIGDPWEPLYPNEEYPIATEVPYDISLYSDSFANTHEFINFINNTDESTYKDGYYFSFFKASRDNGYLLKPKFNGVELDDMIVSKQAYGICANFEERYSGVGYSYYLNTEKNREEISIYYLKKEWVIDANKRPFMYSDGKKNHTSFDLKEAQNRGWTEHKIQDGKYTVYKNENSHVFWVFDGFLIRIVSTTLEDRPNVLDTAEKLTFEKVPLKQSAE